MLFKFLTDKEPQVLLRDACNQESKGNVSGATVFACKRAAETHEFSSLSAPRTSVCDLELSGAEALSSGWLFFPLEAAEPKTWLVFTELGDDPSGCVVFAFYRRFRADVDAAEFMAESFNCFLGLDFGRVPVSHRFGSGRHSEHASRRDVIRSLMSFDEAMCRGRFLVFTDPSPWLTTILLKKGKSETSLRLRCKL